MPKKTPAKGTPALNPLAPHRTSPARDAATQRPDRPLRANSRTILQREADKAFMVKWRARGLTGEALMEKLREHLSIQIPQRTISRAQFFADQKAIDSLWRQRNLETLDQMRNRDLMRLEAVEAELWEQWERSKTPFSKTVDTFTQKGQAEAGAPGAAAPGPKVGPTIHRAKTTEERLGSAEIMALILRVQEQRARLCGYAAPQKVQHSDPDGKPLATGPAVAPIIQITIAPPPTD